MRYLTGYRGAALILLFLSNQACGRFEHKKGQSQSQDATASSANQGGATDVSNLEVLSPGALASKIYAAFGPGMTQTSQGKNQVDYLLLNQSNFVGSVSSDPSNRYASSFSIGYFMALAGLAQVVGDNYNAALAQHARISDCRQQDGAAAILVAIAPTMTTSDASSIAAAFVTACTAKPAAAVSAVVQSYSTALKSTL